MQPAVGRSRRQRVRSSRRRDALPRHQNQHHRCRCFTVCLQPRPEPRPAPPAGFPAAYHQPALRPAAATPPPTCWATILTSSPALTLPVKSAVTPAINVTFAIDHRGQQGQLPTSACFQFVHGFAQAVTSAPSSMAASTWPLDLDSLSDQIVTLEAASFEAGGPAPPSGAPGARVNFELGAADASAKPG